MSLFGDRLTDAVSSRGSSVVVGLDPHLPLFPSPLAEAASSLVRETVADAVDRFCSEIIEVVADIVPAIKPQVAFFEALGPPGWEVLERLVKRAKERGLLVILDAKRGDIGSTATAYADYLLGNSRGLGGLDADALTVSPYLGSDSLLPFTAYLAKGKGIFILAKTSNLASAELQDLVFQTETGEKPVYTAVASMARRLGEGAVGESGYSSVGLVVGATSSSQAIALRAAFPDLLFLLPGYGAQGAGVREVVGAFDSRGGGALVNASRSLIFAYRNEEYSSLGPQGWAEAARRECQRMSAAINRALESPARSPRSE